MAVNSLEVTLPQTRFEMISSINIKLNGFPFNFVLYSHSENI